MTQQQVNNLCQYITTSLINLGLQPSARNRLKEHFIAIGNQIGEKYELLQMPVDKVNNAEVVLYPNQINPLEGLIEELNYVAQQQPDIQITDTHIAVEEIDSIIANYHEHAIREVYYMEDFAFG